MLQYLPGLSPGTPWPAAAYGHGYKILLPTNTIFWPQDAHVQNGDTNEASDNIGCPQVTHQNHIRIAALWAHTPLAWNVEVHTWRPLSMAWAMC